MRLFKLAVLAPALLVLGLGAVSSSVSLAQKTITVCPAGCDYTSIQAAISAAPEGSTIQVRAGTYLENLRITKGLTLQGESKEKVTVQGTVAILSTKLVTMSGFTVKGGQGVQIEDSTTIVLSDNALIESTLEGLLARSSSITVRGNLISRNKSHGLLLTLGSRALITGNTIENNGGDGINVAASHADIRDNVIRENAGCGVRADADSTITGSVTPANTSGNKGGNLCEKAVKLDTEPPAAPVNLRVSPSDWTNQPISIDWTNPDDFTGIAAAWYKLGAEPTRPEDGTRTTSKPVVLKDPPEGRQPIFVWLEDNAGNKSERNRARGLILYDKTPPTGSLSINDGAATTSSTLVTLRISASDALSGVAEMRFSNDGRTWSEWEPFAEVKRDWDLTRFGGSIVTGPKTAYSQLRDRAGNVSPVFSATIRLTTATLSGHTGGVSSVAFSPDGKLLASGSGDDTIKLWEVATGREVRTLSGHTRWVSSVAFSPNGKLLASGSDDHTIKLWEVATGREVRTLPRHTHEVTSVAFSPDGKLLASSGTYERTIKLWEVATGREVRTLSGHTWSVHSVAFSPDGKLLASGSHDKTIKLWDVATGKEVRTLSGHAGIVFSVAFSPDGKLLASGSKDKTIKLWDVATGSEVRTLRGHTRDVWSVAFSPDRKLLASGSSDYTIKLWDISDLVGR